MIWSRREAQSQTSHWQGQLPCRVTGQLTTSTLLEAEGSVNRCTHVRCVRLRPGQVKLGGLQVFVTQPRFQVIERSAVMVQLRCVSLPEVVQLELFAHWCRLARAWLLVCQRVSELFNAVATVQPGPFRG